VGPTYGEYEKYSLLAGSEIIQYRPPESTRFKPEIDKLCRIIQKKKPALTWICNPNNPTGTVLCSDELTEIAKSCEKAGGRLIIDEAYINFMPPETRRTITGKNVITMRSMTKDFSLPGLRLGYITADRKTTDSLKKIQPVWSVNVQAQTAGTAALKTLPIYERQWENLRRAKAGFLSMLEDFDLEIYPGSANFILAKQRQTEAKEWKELLLDAGILVRDCSSFGLPGFVRFGVLRTENNRRFTKELRRLKIWEK
jgi:histidinol-phosphate/aromatic aminotransferase/cobyric acid decarboxylase-like protein